MKIKSDIGTMTKEEVIRLGLLTEEQLRNAPVMSVEEFDAMIEREKAYIPVIEKTFQDLMDLYEDICY